jgi:ElaB/YqjD/DUF883 family membrane-anchored ribosome-binding protein
MKNNKDTVHSPKELINELHALIGEAETMMAASVSEHSSEAFGKLRARFAAAQERLSDIYDGAKRKVVAGARYTDTAIRENPYQALAIALGIGVLAGVLLGRRSKD